MNLVELGYTAAFGVVKALPRRVAWPAFAAVAGMGARRHRSGKAGKGTARLAAADRLLAAAARAPRGPGGGAGGCDGLRWTCDVRSTPHPLLREVRVGVATGEGDRGAEGLVGGVRVPPS